MKIHEYQAKALLKKYGVAIQDGVAIRWMEEFDNAINTLRERGVQQFVVKSQIHAGGRGKGTVKRRHPPDDGGRRGILIRDAYRHRIRKEV